MSAPQKQSECWNGMLVTLFKPLIGLGRDASVIHRYTGTGTSTLVCCQKFSVPTLGVDDDGPETLLHGWYR